jgi:F-type H+-transporting ATPase subunit c
MKTLRLLALVVMVAFLLASPVLAQETSNLPRGNMVLAGAGFGAGIGAALTIIGAGWGFGRIGSSALESMARQPEVAGRIQTAMIVIAALLEGVVLFSLIICIIMALTVKY